MLLMARITLLAAGCLVFTLVPAASVTATNQGERGPEEPFDGSQYAEVAARCYTGAGSGGVDVCETSSSSTC